MTDKPECHCVDSSPCHKWWQCRPRRDWCRAHQHELTTERRTASTRNLKVCFKVQVQKVWPTNCQHSNLVNGTAIKTVYTAFSHAPPQNNSNSEMTYTVSGGALNFIHSIRPLRCHQMKIGLLLYYQ